MSANKSLLKSGAIISLGTNLSRIFGFIRDIVIARFFGTAAAAQAFVVALRIPNLFRHLIGEGTLQPTVVPQFSALWEKGQKQEFWRLANCLMNVLLVILVLMVLLGELLCPLLVRIIAPGFMREPEKLLLTVRLARLMFPYFLLIGMTAYIAALLNALKHFFFPAFAPALLNLGIIFSVLALKSRLAEPVDSLAWGVLIGGVMQLAVQIPALLRRGFGRYRLIFRHPLIKNLFRLFLPRSLGVAIYQVSILVDTVLASFSGIVGAGAVAALWYANRIVQYPQAVVGLAVARAALPTLSREAAKNDIPELKNIVRFLIKTLTLVMIPATVGIVILHEPIIRLIFQRGAFSAYSTWITSWALLFYAFGLFAYSGIKTLAYTFYSLRDTLTPAKTAGVCLVVNVGLNLLLMKPLGVGGLALATATAAVLNFFYLWRRLQQRIGPIGIPQLALFLQKVMLATAAMGTICGWLYYGTGIVVRINDAARLVLAIGASAATYLVCGYLLNITEIRKLCAVLFRKK
jgi:putative peptidoglycan lipid II flippase